MKTALISFGGADYKRIRELFFSCGIELSTVELLSKSDDIGFKRSFEYFRDTAEVLIVSSGAEFDVKEKVAEFLGVPLAENENARKSLYEKGEDLSGALMPIESTYLPNDGGVFQGFLVEDRYFTLAVLPGKSEQFIGTCEKYLLPYLETKAGIKEKHIFKCFGEKNAIEELVLPLKEKYGFNYTVSEENYDATLTVFFMDSEKSKDALREIAETVSDICYTDGQETLSQTLFTLLKLRNKKIAVAESFTGGRVAQNIVKNSGASDYFCEGIVAYSNDSKIHRLSVPESDINKLGAVSAKVAFKMAVGLFSHSDCDVVLATTGLAGPNGDGTGLPVGLCFIAVGTKAGIHTYKMEFSGDREQITQKGVNAAMFYAVKNIKNL